VSATHDIIIVGAGLAGLRAAQILDAAGRDVLVLEASSQLGGRIVTDRVDGFLVDRGFQLLNPAYPQIRHCVTLAELDLHRAAAAVRVYHEGRSVVWGNPLSDRRAAPTIVSRALTGLRTVPTLARWAFTLPDSTDTRSTYSALVASSLPSDIRELIMIPFLRGVLLDEQLDTPFAYTQLVLRTLVRAQPGLPAQGMNALPRAMARRLTRSEIRYDEPVESVSPRSVRTENGEHHAQFVIDARSIRHDENPRRVTTWWWSAPATSDRTVVLDAFGGRLLNALDVAAVNPHYAPAGRGLIAASALRDYDDDVIRGDVARLFGCDVRELDLVARHDVERALPRCQTLPARASAWRDGIITAGDTVATPSIQGALASGADAARRVLTA
jgi:hypothetical protein